jgi:hypothetical protein
MSKQPRAWLYAVNATSEPARRSLEKAVALAGNRVNAFLTIHPYKLFAMGLG